MKKSVSLIGLILFFSNSYAQKKDIGIKDAIYYMAFSPATVADMLKKEGFEKVNCIGHPWNESQVEDVCMMNDNSQVIAISPRKLSKGSNILIMFVGSDKNSKFDKELLKENFEDLRINEEGANGTWSGDTWALMKNGFSQSVYFNRKKMLKETPEQTNYFIYINYLDAGDGRPYHKYEPEEKWIPGKKYLWESEKITFLLPNGAVTERGSYIFDSIHITWPGGDWTNGPVHIGEMFSTNYSTGKVTAPWQVVYKNLAPLSKDRTDSLIYKQSDNPKLSLYLIESNGTSNGKLFFSTFFAFTPSEGKIVYGDYTSFNKEKGIQTRKILRKLLLATFKNGSAVSSK